MSVIPALRKVKAGESRLYETLSQKTKPKNLIPRITKTCSFFLLELSKVACLF
jgi:hypothetical protein